MVAIKQPSFYHSTSRVGLSVMALGLDWGGAYLDGQEGYVSWT